jgi:lysine 2-monooxygenase
MIGRRDFLRQVGGGTLFALSAPLSMLGVESKEGEYDLVVVGGGVAETYCSWRLSEANEAGRIKIGLFEASDRIGGRLFSIRPPGFEKECAELGGMRIGSDQGFTHGLVSELGLSLLPDPPETPENFYYLRGTRWRQGETKKFPIPYDVGPECKGLSNDEIRSLITERLTGQGQQLTRSQWESVKQSAQYKGRPLIDYGYEEVLAQVLGAECCRFYCDTVGYDFLNANAAEWAQDMGSELGNTVFYGVADGYQQVPLRMAERFERKGGSVRLESALTSLEFADDDRLKLVFRTKSGSTLSVRSRAVILTLPPAVLSQLLASGGLPESPVIRQACSATEPIGALKNYFTYGDPWWSKAGLSSGRSITDLPLRQCFYHNDDPSGRGMLLASYAAGEPCGKYWKPLLERDSDKAGSYSGFEITSTPVAMVTEINRQLALLHGQKQIPMPDQAFTHHWAREGLEAAWHSWRPGTRTWDLLPKIRQPIADRRLFLCGEAFSTSQGWVLGSLESAEHVLRDHFGLTPPAWMPSGIPLGA